MDIILFLIGVVFLTKGVVPISKDTRLSVSGGRILGIVLMTPAAFFFLTDFLNTELPEPYTGFILYGGMVTAAILIAQFFKETIPTEIITGYKTPVVAWIGLLLVLAVLTGGAYQLYKIRSENRRASQDLHKFLIGESIPTEGWKTYRNEKFGFELNIPNAWDEFRVAEETHPPKEFKGFFGANIAHPSAQTVYSFKLPYPGYKGSFWQVFSVSIISRQAADELSYPDTVIRSRDEPDYRLKIVKTPAHLFVLYYGSCQDAPPECADLVKLGEGTAESFRVLK